MQVEDLFEDLEAQFSAHLDSRVSPANSELQQLAHINTKQLEQLSLIAPIIGIDYVAGLATQQPKLIIIPLRECERLNFSAIADSNFPNLRHFNATLQQLLCGIKTPAQLSFSTGGAQLSTGILLEVQPALLRIQTAQNAILVPLAAISRLEIVAVDNLSDW